MFPLGTNFRVGGGVTVGLPLLRFLFRIERFGSIIFPPGTNFRGICFETPLDWRYNNMGGNMVGWGSSGDGDLFVKGIIMIFLQGGRSVYNR